MFEKLSEKADFAEQLLHQLGPFRVLYNDNERDTWDRMGWTLRDRDRAIEQLIAQGRANIRLRPGGVEVRLAERRYFEMD